MGIYGEASKNLINKISSSSKSSPITHHSFGYSSNEKIIGIKNGGHWLHLENQAEVSEHIGQFYSEIDSKEK